MTGGSKFKRQELDRVANREPCHHSWPKPDWEPARQKLIYCESGRIDPYSPDLSANRTTMHLQIEKIRPRFPAFSLRLFLPRRLLAYNNRREVILLAQSPPLWSRKGVQS